MIEELLSNEDALIAEWERHLMEELQRDMEQELRLQHESIRD